MLYGNLKLFEYMVEKGGSDLFLKTNSKPSIRLDGKIEFIADKPLSAENMWNLFNKLLDDSSKKDFEEFGETDFAISLPNIGRFRANVFRYMSQHAMVFRHVQDRIYTFEELHLPISLKKLAQLSRGLVLATGIAGSGKSTTLASILEYINQTYSKHVITVEDPIEYVFKEKKCIFSQREVGIDTESFEASLKHAMRQSPDVILIGEMRDKTTVETAINAAETGHLVFSTLHTLNAPQTIERIIMFFPPYQHEMLRKQLALILEGIISIRLIKKKSGSGRVPAIEMLLKTPTIREMLANGEIYEIRKALADGNKHFGTMTFNQSLKVLYEKDFITIEDAMKAADNPEELKMFIRGISKGSRNFIPGQQPVGGGGGLRPNSLGGGTKITKISSTRPLGGEQK